MSCKKCNKSRWYNLSKIKGSDNTPSPVFSGTWGKIVYFLILLIVALTPLINLIAIYLFAKAVFGGSNKTIKNEHKNPNVNK